MDFDLQDIWSAAGAAAAAVVVGYLFGFIQSAVPAITNSAAFRNYALIVLSVGLVALAAVNSGAQPDTGNVLSAALVAIGIYNAAKNAHGAGEATAVKAANGSEIGGGPSEPPKG